MAGYCGFLPRNPELLIKAFEQVLANRRREIELYFKHPEQGTAGHMKTLTPVKDDPRFVFIHGDITDRSTVDATIEAHKPDIVITFMAESHVDRSIDNPGAFLQTNIIGTQNLMDACCKFGSIHFHLPAHIPPAKRRRICWRLPITAPLDCR